MQKINIFIPSLLENLPILPFLEDKLLIDNKSLWKNRLFQRIDFPEFNSDVDIVSDINISDFVLIPHDFSYLINEKKYLRDIYLLSNKKSKKVVIFFYADSSQDIGLEEFIIIRSSRYKSDLLSNEIVMPAYVEDLSLKYAINYRDKSQIPTIGFTGWALFSNYSHHVKYIIKILFYSFIGIFDSKSLLLRPGIYFRRKAIKYISLSKNIQSSFNIRTNYSGHRHTITISPEIARKEFVDNILNSDFSLVVKGDGNYSLRFFEVLSLGRIPLFIDTDCPLPLEDVINYDEFILRINHNEINKIGNIVTSFYRNLTPEKFVYMQKKAREAFNNYLYTDVFISKIFRNIKNDDKK